MHRQILETLKNGLGICGFTIYPESAHDESTKDLTVSLCLHHHNDTIICRSIETIFGLPVDLASLEPNKSLQCVIIQKK